VKSRPLVIYLWLGLSLAACGSPPAATQVVPSPTPRPASPSPVATATATFTAVPTETSSPTATPRPTSTVVLTATATLTPTVAPTATLTLCLPSAAYVEDVTVPDDTVFGSGEAFTKVWRMRSSGCAPWPSGSRWVFVSGDQMGAPDGVDVPDTPLGGVVDLSVPMQAPTTPGAYRGFWQMQTPGGSLFGQRVYVAIVVPAAAPLPQTLLTVELLIVNDTGGDVSVRFVGREVYDFTLSVGEHLVTMLPGVYGYTATLCDGEEEEGTKVVPYYRADEPPPLARMEFTCEG